MENFGDGQAMQEEMEHLSRLISKAKEQMSNVIVGQQALVDRLFIALLADGHLLLEGVPGLAKTLAVTTLAKVIDADYKRIQFTPDLLPADLIGTSIYHPADGSFSVKKGPIFTHILLADEINRAPAKVQSALLEVMQEKQVTIGGETFRLQQPYFVLGTQNPIEQEGTYPLPEAQTDRFMMKVKIGYPTQEEERIIMSRMGQLGSAPKVEPVLTIEEILKGRLLLDRIHVDSKIIHYLLDIVFATRDPAAFNVPIEGLLVYGASPRASLHLLLASRARALLSGRHYVIPDDVHAIVFDVLRHRLRRSYEAEAENISPDEIIQTILNTLPAP